MTIGSANIYWRRTEKENDEILQEDLLSPRLLEERLWRVYYYTSQRDYFEHFLNNNNSQNLQHRVKYNISKNLLKPEGTIMKV